jgi:hypothetical protein
VGTIRPKLTPFQTARYADHRRFKEAIHFREIDKLANQVGKRYMCTKCNSEMIVTKAGEGDLGCCGQPMQQK